MNDTVDMHKAGGVILKDRHFLVTRSFGKDVFVAPGGKLENNETPAQALEREMTEEVNVRIDVDTLEHLGAFYAEAAGKAGVKLQMDVYLVNSLVGKPTPSSEIEEIKWVNTQTKGIKIGSIFEHDVMPLLKSRGLID